jgi:hypothetical protein
MSCNKWPRTYVPATNVQSPEHVLHFAIVNVRENQGEKPEYV